MWQYFLNIWQSFLDFISYLLLNFLKLFKPKPPKPYTLEAFDALTTHLEELLNPLEIVIRDKSYQKGLDWEVNADIQLYFFRDAFHPIMIQALIKNLDTLFLYRKDKYGMTALYLNTRQLPDSHPLWAHQGRLSAYHQLIDELMIGTLDLNDRLGENLIRLSQEFPHLTKENSLKLLQDHLSIFKKELLKHNHFTQKTQIFKDLIALYERIRDYHHLKTLLMHKESFRLNWFFKNSQLRTKLPLELNNNIMEFLIPPLK
jgi:hypothetical protein